MKKNNTGLNKVNSFTNNIHFQIIKNVHFVSGTHVKYNTPAVNQRNVGH